MLLDRPRPAVPHTPEFLASHLIAWWVADAAYLTLSGSNVTAWAARVGGGGFTVSQGAGGAQPVFTPGALAGRDAVVFDGTDDFLEATGFPSGLPTGTVGTEIWAVCENTATDAVSARQLLAYGGVSVGQHRRLTRTSTGVYSATDGSSTVLSRMSDQGRVVIGARFGEGRSETIIRNNYCGLEVSAAGAGSLVGTRLRIGASTATSASAFWQGSMRHILITRPLIGPQVDRLVAWGNAEAGRRL